MSPSSLLLPPDDIFLLLVLLLVLLLLMLISTLIATESSAAVAVDAAESFFVEAFAPLLPLLIKNGLLKNASKPRRSLGSLRKSDLIKATHSGESVSAILVGILASDRSMLCNNCTWFCPVKGTFPTTISNKIAPTLHKSAFASYFLYFKISGAMYNGLPHTVSAIPPCG